jgi:hypothetical protein
MTVKEIEMDKNRFLVLILGATLVVAVTLIALGFNAAPEAKGSSAPSIGFGDLHRFEGQLAPVSSQANAGMGDLHRYEVRPILLASVAQGNSASFARMGDLRRFEAQQLLKASGNSYAGMGDLHRYEALQGIQQ